MSLATDEGQFTDMRDDEKSLVSSGLLDDIAQYQQKTMILWYKVMKFSRVVQQFLKEIETAVDLPFMDDATDLLNTEGQLLSSEINLAHELRRIEIDFIKLALKHSHGKQVEAARMLGMKATTLNSKMRKYRISLPK